MTVAWEPGPPLGSGAPLGGELRPGISPLWASVPFGQKEVLDF